MRSAFCDHGMLRQVAGEAGLKSEANARLLEWETPEGALATQTGFEDSECLRRRAANAAPQSTGASRQVFPKA